MVYGHHVCIKVIMNKTTILSLNVRLIPVMIANHVKLNDFLIAGNFAILAPPWLGEDSQKV